MTDEATIKLFKCLSDKSRLQIMKALAIEPMYVERLSERLGLTPATISFHMKKLEDAGVVESHKDQYYVMYSLKKDLLTASILDIISTKTEETELQEERDEQYRQKVISSFFEYGKLKTIPSQRKKERICLLEIAKAFQPSRAYTEREVNLIIADFNDDFCTIRRDMVDEGILCREKQIYSLCNK